ncbi:MAG: diguanylate cyclase [Actinobacteria bacterium]|nr:diguanylate cyclase [Actinomycetota bacterium]
MAEVATAPTATERPRAAKGLSPMAAVARAVLVLGALGVLGAWTVLDFPDDPRWAAFGVLTGAAVVLSYLQERRQLMPMSVSMVVVGATTLVLSPPLALWCAFTLGVFRALRGERTSRLVVTSSSLVLTNALAAWVRLLADEHLGDQPVVSSADGAIGMRTALAVALALALGWQLSRWIGAWIDQRSMSATWRLHAHKRWLRDMTFAATAIVLAIAWVLYPPSILLVLVPLLVALQQGATDVFTDEVSSVDELTALASSGMLRVALAEELARSERFDREVSVIVVDVDEMSELNLQYGHTIGDDVVRGVADRIRSVARDYDVVARIGGDSFALLLPETAEDGARIAAERLSEAMRSGPIRVDGGATSVPVSVSIGVATFPGDADQRETLLTEAELAAAFARLEGGDRIAAASKLPEGFHRAASAPGRASDAVLARFAGTDAMSGDGGPFTPSDDPLTTSSIDSERLVRASSEPLGGAKPRTDRLLLAAAIVAAAVSIVAITNEPGIADVGRFALFAGIAVAAEWFAESIYGRANASWSAVPLIGLAVTPALPAAVVLAAVIAGIGGGVIRGVRARQALFNTAVLVLSTLAASVVAKPLTSGVLSAEVELFAAGAVAGVAFFVIDTWLVATAVALSSGAPVFEIWREDLAWLLPHQVGMGLLAGVMAFAHDRIGILGTLVLVIPALGLHFAQRQFVSRTRDHVVRLRNLNDDLQHANTRVVRVNERLTDALEQVNQGYLVTVESLALAVDAKDSYTGSHIDRVEAFGSRLLEVLDPELRDDEAMLWGFRLHDVGKIGVPDSVLLKPGPLDEEEWELMRRHPDIGAQIVSEAPFLQGARDIILHHHERWDGRGYPHGLREMNIPFGARLFSLIDAFDAMTSDRPYRKAMAIDEALHELMRHAGTQFDPEMIEAFLQIDPNEFGEIRARVDARRDARQGRSGGRLIPIAEGYEPSRLAAHG